MESTCLFLGFFFLGGGGGGGGGEKHCSEGKLFLRF